RYLSSCRGLRDQLARYGDANESAKSIDDELRDLRNSFVLGQTTVALGSPQPDCLIMTENWFVRLCPGGSVIIRLPDLAWVHKRIVMRSALLSQGRMDYELGFRMRNGEACTFDTWTEGKTDQVLRELLQRRPELLIGYRGEWLDLFANGEPAVV